MKYKFHAYTCNDCTTLFAGEAHEDVDHSDIACPFCGCEDVESAGNGEMELIPDAK
jgi:DNA-directed RNA polymerase subunit RPC12/RpoP